LTGAYDYKLGCPPQVEVTEEVGEAPSVPLRRIHK
jgi:hypothetical protein